MYVVLQLQRPHHLLAWLPSCTEGSSPYSSLGQRCSLAQACSGHSPNLDYHKLAHHNYGCKLGGEHLLREKCMINVSMKFNVNKLTLHSSITAGDTRFSKPFVYDHHCQNCKQSDNY